VCVRAIDRTDDAAFGAAIGADRSHLDKHWSPCIAEPMKGGG